MTIWLWNSLIPISYPTKLPLWPVNSVSFDIYYVTIANWRQIETGYWQFTNNNLIYLNRDWNLIEGKIIISRFKCWHKGQKNKCLCTHTERKTMWVKERHCLLIIALPMKWKYSRSFFIALDLYVYVYRFRCVIISVACSRSVLLDLTFLPLLFVPFSNLPTVKITFFSFSLASFVVLHSIISLSSFSCRSVN